MTTVLSDGDKPDRREASIRALFISYDGLTDPLGRSQILPYLTGLAALGHKISILSCDKPERYLQSGARVRELCKNAGIIWRSLPYHHRPAVVSGMYDLWRLDRVASAMQRQHRFDVIHCRSYLPALVGLKLKRRFGAPFIFDMRGFWPEERTEAGDWNLANPLFRQIYQFFKRREAVLLQESDQIVSLTAAAAAVLERRGPVAPIDVIPCCVDFTHFPLTAASSRNQARQALGISSNASVLIYLGSLGGNHLLDEMLNFYNVFRARQSDPARFVFITQSPREMVESAASKFGLNREEIIVRSASREEVPGLLAAADAGVAFKRPAFSALACSPTKLGEMLATGIPVVANAGVGDVAAILGDVGGGCAIAGLDPQFFEDALESLDHAASPERLRQRALSWFSLDEGVARYDQIYRRLASRQPRTVASACIQSSKAVPA